MSPINYVPGISAILSRNVSEYSITPIDGCNVVNGYDATSGFALLSTLSSDDLPVFE